VSWESVKTALLSMNRQAAEFLQSDTAVLLLAIISAAVLLVLIFSGLLRRIFSSMTWAQIFMLLAAPYLAGGLVFPQTGSYQAIERVLGADSTVVHILKMLHVGKLYSSPAFIIIFDLILLSTAFCSLRRLFSFLTRERKGERTKAQLQHMNGYVAMRLPEEIEKSPEEHVKKALRKIGIRPVKLPAGVRRKGIGGLFMSVAWHFGLALLLLGCVITYFGAFEGQVTLRRGETKNVPLRSDDTLWAKLEKMAASGLAAVKSPKSPQPKTAAPQLRVTLKEFKVRWAETASFDHPRHRIVKADTKRPVKLVDRMATGLEAGFKLFQEKLKKSVHKIEMKLDPAPKVPLSFRSDLQIADPKKGMFEGSTRVNRPLRHGKIRLYQVAYSYDIEFAVLGKGTVKAATYKPFSLPGTERKFIATVKTGVLKKLDGTEQPLSPVVTVYPLPTKAEREFARPVFDEIVLHEGKQGDVLGLKVTPKVVGASSILQYCYDPALPLLRIGMIVVLVALAVRIYLPRYRVRYLLEVSEARAVLHVVGSEQGLFADGPRLLKKLKSRLNA